MQYLDKTYLEKFVVYLNQDICPLAEEIIKDSDTCETLFLGTLNYGFKAVAIRYFELQRYLGMQYNKVLSSEILNSPEFYEISKLKFFLINA